MKERIFIFLTAFLMLGVFQVKAQGSENLDGAEYVDYILNKGGLVRIANRRTTTANLTDDGTKTLGARANVNNLQQVWILQKNNKSYTLRNASTGRFLSSDDNYRSPSAAPKMMYIQ